MQEEHNVAGGEGINLSTADGFCGERFPQPAYWLIPDPDGVVGFIGPTTPEWRTGVPAKLKGPITFIKQFGSPILITISVTVNTILSAIGFMITQNRNITEKALCKIAPATEAPDYFWKYYPQFTKFIRVNDHPADIIQDAKTGLLYASARRSYLDQYYLRLAETYLLRAEAYVDMNNLSAAAKDINVVRSRAKATPVAETNVNIDYVLDERMRELGWEEQRRLTLCRVGKLVETNQKIQYLCW